ncbi:50S ribosomal protein L35 [Riemerella anatipestifer]|nr:50S ribosomal protein L35 [Riemerella anatipestifer]
MKNEIRAKKRFALTGTGKIKRKKCLQKSTILTKKETKQREILRKLCSFI